MLWPKPLRLESHERERLTALFSFPPRDQGHTPCGTFSSRFTSDIGRGGGGRGGGGRREEEGGGGRKREEEEEEGFKAIIYEGGWAPGVTARRRHGLDMMPMGLSSPSFRRRRRPTAEEACSASLSSSFSSSFKPCALHFD